MPFDNQPQRHDIGRVAAERYLDVMLFWVIAGLLTLGASLAVLLPLSGRRSGGAGSASHDLEVYRDQIAELDRDAQRGLIGASEAEQARAEIARRILKADHAARTETASIRSDSKGIRALGMVAVLAVPLVSWGIYAVTGSPDLPSQPLAARLDKNPADSSAEELVARAEAHLAANPDDGRGWDVLAPIYARMGRAQDAVTAYRNAIRLSGANGGREAGLGEAITAIAGGTVTADAQAAFVRALELEPGQPKASFFLASALAQDGRIGEAVAAWQGILAALPTDSPWRDAVDQAIAEGNRQLAMVRNDAPGPSKEQIEAASDMPQQDRSEMIEGMVASLDEKLRQNPRDLEGWMKLVRSYHVLGRPEAARDALDRGVAALGPDGSEAKQLSALSDALGLKAAE